MLTGYEQHFFPTVILYPRDIQKTSLEKTTIAKGLKGFCRGKKESRVLVADYRIEHVLIKLNGKVFFDSMLDPECFIIKIFFAKSHSLS